MHISVSSRAADITWDYKKVVWDYIGITEKTLGLYWDSEKRRNKQFWDSVGILNKAVWDSFGDSEINSRDSTRIT